ncbi:uncharacterized protein G2W53_003577 [Senna tora]|uniref:Uncharacterized protein n=1 Tax=Senna tora TaxID=362788 RepID=A0A834XBS6_9FABA|nr:uncharacterized protein G2W53_003577 [Senna tora]
MLGKPLDHIQRCCYAESISIGYKRIEGRLGRGMLFGEVKTITNRMRQEERRRGNGLQDWVSRVEL